LLCLVAFTLLEYTKGNLLELIGRLLYFQVDRKIGKDHLFKRSIILVKAWCYYESRILGAHHGLISTYALETLVLYIFHLFHASLHGPLEVGVCLIAKHVPYPRKREIFISQKFTQIW